MAETKIIKKKVGCPTKYTKELAKSLTDDLVYMSLKEACKKHGINERSYYRWLHLEEEFCQFSIRARKTKATYHFDKATEVLQELDDDPNNEDTRADTARLRFDGHLRLAGKANQGLYGDKGLTVNTNTQVNNNTTIELNDILDERLLDLLNINKKLEDK